ncbi:MAG: DUF624 domain-containing protein [Lachnospiraceae bacterium]|nr:DUF624 domain-containing protein [Lachnospiraceae bacterium]
MFNSEDNKIIQALGRIGNLILINLLWIVFGPAISLAGLFFGYVLPMWASMLIITLGTIMIMPANIAFYYTVNKVVRKDESFIISTFFSSYLRVFGKTCFLSLILGSTTILVYLNVNYLSTVSELKSLILLYSNIVIFFMGLAWYLVLVAVYSRFKGKMKFLADLSLEMAIRFLPRTVGILIITVAAFLVCSNISLVFLLVIPGAAVLLICFLAEPMLSKYTKQENDSEE